MAAKAPIAAVFGCTGMVGGHILNTLLASESYSAVHSVSRRAPKAEGAKLHATVDEASDQWPAKIGKLEPGPVSAVFSALGTTRAQAGSIEAQWKIDHDLNVEIARAAKEAGVPTFVFVSSGGTRSALSKLAPYSKMKIGVEDSVKELAFDQAIILRPGFIMGERDQPHGGMGAGLMGVLMGGLGRVSGKLVDAMGQDGLVIGRAAVAAEKLAREGKAPSKYWVLEQADIVRLGRDEWETKETKA